jgi:hypothetical protein
MKHHSVVLELVRVDSWTDMQINIVKQINAIFVTVALKVP